MEKKESRKEIDEKYMDYALKLAEKGRGTTTPNPMVGAIIVKDGRIIGEGFHVRSGESHAEVIAFQNATEDVAGGTMYVTLEPCSHYGKTPPCAELIIDKYIKRVVIATLDPNPMVSGRGARWLRNCGVEVTVGVLEKQARKLNEVFMKYIVTKRPFVLFKAAMSLDGKIATADGESRWISSLASREEVHRLRHEYTGIMVGIGTVLADEPMLNCRIPGAKQPVRIVVDSQLRIPEDSRLVQTAREYPLIIGTTSQADEEKVRRLEALGVTVKQVPKDADGHVDLNIWMESLGKMQIDSILLEGGGSLAESALRAGIVDKIQFYIAPLFIGGREARTPIEGKGIQKLSQAWQVSEWQTECEGSDIKITGYLRKDR